MRFSVEGYELLMDDILNARGRSTTVTSVDFHVGKILYRYVVFILEDIALVRFVQLLPFI